MKGLFMFIEIDEPFICEKCGKSVEPLGYTSRDHCPYCLYSKHVDKDPGDRAEECHGALKPIGLENNAKKGYTIIYQCEKCGAIRKNKMANDDDFDLLMKIVAENSFKF
ncbi:MAG: RNHCP domain-containing protein [Clostridia bacterium]|nr:RNHCP domain-containing protein [Clostridia bacterium]